MTGVSATDAAVAELIAELDRELAAAGYPDEEMYGYSIADLDRPSIRLVVAARDGVAVGVGGLELGADGNGELKRCYVRPDHRGSGVADGIIRALLDIAREQGASFVRLETGTQQHAAVAFYRRHGFEHIDRFGPYVGSASSVCMQLTL